MLCYTLSVYRRCLGRVGSLDPVRRPRSIPLRVADLATAFEAAVGSVFARLVAGRLESTRRPVLILAAWRGNRPGFDFLPQLRIDRPGTPGAIQPRRAEEPGTW